jgi:Cu-Zn family superoxide dismutase
MSTHRLRRRLVAGLAVVFVSAGVVFVTQLPGSADPAVAKATLRDASGNTVGLVRFTPSGTILLAKASVTLPSASSEFHGFHVHANNDPANGDGCIADPGQPSNTWFVSADGHWNPGAVTHGHHAGDMPSLLRDASGRAYTTFQIPVNAGDLIGKVVIVHAGPDNFANVPLGAAADQYTANAQAAIDKTNATGNAGDRFACGVIVPA